MSLTCHYLNYFSFFSVILFGTNSLMPMHTVVDPVVCDNGKSWSLLLQIWLFSFFQFSWIHCMSLTYHYLYYLSLNISNIWCEIDSPLTLLHSTLKLYLEYIWSIIGGLIFTKVRDRIWTPGWHFFVKQSEGYLVHTETICFISS